MAIQLNAAARIQETRGLTANNPGLYNPNKKAMAKEIAEKAGWGKFRLSWHEPTSSGTLSFGRELTDEEFTRGAKKVGGKKQKNGMVYALTLQPHDIPATLTLTANGQVSVVIKR